MHVPYYSANKSPGTHGVVGTESLAWLLRLRRRAESLCLLACDWWGIELDH